VKKRKNRTIINHTEDKTQKIQKAKKQAERTAISPQKKSAAKRTAKS